MLEPVTTSSASPTDDRRTPPRSRWFKGLLLGLLLTMAALLLWQLRQEFAQQLQHQRQRSYDYAAQISGQLALNLELQVQSTLELLRQHALRPAPGEQSDALLQRLQGAWPGLLGLAWLSPEGGLLADSAANPDDLPYLLSLPAHAGAQAYYLSRGPQADSPLYLLFRQPASVRPGGFWVARLIPDALQQLLPQQLPEHQHWRLEERSGERLIAHSAVHTDDNLAAAHSTRVLPLANSDWQLRGLLDVAQLRAQLLPALLGKLLLFIICSAMTLLTLTVLQREQRWLRASHASSRRALDQAAIALGSIEERVLLTDDQGRISYLNPQAEQLLGKTFSQVRGVPLETLLPGLALRLHNRGDANDAEDFLLELTQDGQARTFSVSRSALGAADAHHGYVWMLRDISAEQQARRGLEQTQRRYQEIFEGTGTALCVLDLSDLHSHLQALGLSSQDDLSQWLDANPQAHSGLLKCLRVSEINRVTERLLGVTSAEQTWQLLIGHGPLRDGGIRQQLISCALSGQRQLEAEIKINTAQGHMRYLWLVMQLPELIEDYHAVTLSISDITTRKRIELSLIERENFWSDVVKAIPDTLYVHDIPGKRVMFSNNHLGPQLGYSKTEMRQLGERLWEKILHPDDQELYGRMRSLQQVVSDGQLLQCQLRWRHRDGSWHWFDIREQALSRDSHGHVSRLIGIAKDVTEQIEASESLRESERRYRLLAESTSNVIFSTNRQLELVYVSPSVERTLGYSTEWIMQHGFFATAANRNQLESLYQLLEQIRQGLSEPTLLARLRSELPTQLFMFDCLHANGLKVPTELSMTLMWDEYGHFEGLLGIGRDITQQRQATKDLRMAATVFEHSTAAILVTDPAGYIVQVNEAFSRISGYASSDALDQLPSLLTSSQVPAEQLHFILDQLRHSGSWEGEVRLKRKGGGDYPAWVGITAVQDDEGDLVSYVAFFSDISERKASEQRIHRLAYYDPLTLLPNRTLFQDRLHTALQAADRHQQWVVLMFLDLDRFKPINDSLGHAAGDRMLKEVAVRLRACVDSDDTVARMGGDEFTLLLQSQAQREGALTRAIHVGEQILASLAQPFILEGREFFVTASIGIALSPQDGNELSQLMKNADTAMYHAKERGKNNFQFYQADMNASALQRLELESDLRHALEQGEFKLFYQPQFSGDGKRLTGAEALLRWQHPQRGLVPPSDFIPVLEELGLVVQVGDWVLRESCRQLAEWHEAKIRVPKISVNLSARQFAEGDLHQRIAQILEQSGVPAACLELELTESILMEDVANAMQTLSSLKQLGVFIAIDDFGTGYSSLNYLKQFPIDVLKIDRSFVDGLPHGEQDGQIARAIIAMAHSLNLTVIAEGVETLAQLDFLRGHDCDEVQGFLLGRPMPAHQFTALFTGTALFMLS